MSWLRIDDGFSRHPKVTALSHKDRWVWVDVLCYCARYQTGGWLPANIREHVAGATAKFLATCVELELLDDVGGELQVHDWSTYAPKDPSGAERQMAWRKKQRESGGVHLDTRSGQWKQARREVFARDNGICADCGRDCKTPRDERDIWNADHVPHREDLVAAGLSIYDIDYIVTRCHSCHAKRTRQEEKERKARNGGVTENGSDISVTSRAGTARVPVLSCPKEVLTKAVVLTTPPQRPSAEEIGKTIEHSLREAS